MSGQFCFPCRSHLTGSSWNFLFNQASSTCVTLRIRVFLQRGTTGWFHRLLGDRRQYPDPAAARWEAPITASPSREHPGALSAQTPHALLCPLALPVLWEADLGLPGSWGSLQVQSGQYR